jgi:hypothetical protein
MNEWVRVGGVVERPLLGWGGGPAFSYSSGREISKERRLVAVEVFGVGEGEWLSNIHRRIPKREEAQYIGEGVGRMK